MSKLFDPIRNLIEKEKENNVKWGIEQKKKMESVFNARNSSNSIAVQKSNEWDKLDEILNNMNENKSIQQKKQFKRVITSKKSDIDSSHVMIERTYPLQNRWRQTIVHPIDLPLRKCDLYFPLRQKIDIDVSGLTVDEKERIVRIGFYAFLHYTQRQQHINKVVVKAVHKWKYKRRKVCIDRWVLQAEIKYRRKIIVSVVQMQVNKTLLNTRMVFWHRQTKIRQWFELKTVKRNAQFRMALFHCWIEFTVLHISINRFRNKWTRQLLVGKFKHWKKMKWVFRENKRLQIKVIQHVQLKCVNKWAHFAWYKHKRRALYARFFHKQQQRNVNIHFKLWRQFVHNLVFIRMAEATANKQMVIKCWKFLILYHNKRKRRKRYTRVAWLHRRNVVIRQHLAGWHDSFCKFKLQAVKAHIIGQKLKLLRAFSALSHIVRLNDSRCLYMKGVACRIATCTWFRFRAHKQSLTGKARKAKRMLRFKHLKRLVQNWKHQKRKSTWNRKVLLQQMLKTQRHVIRQWKLQILQAEQFRQNMDMATLHYERTLKYRTVFGIGLMLYKRKVSTQWRTILASVAQRNLLLWVFNLLVEGVQTSHQSRASLSKAKLHHTQVLTFKGFTRFRLNLGKLRVSSRIQLSKAIEWHNMSIQRVLFCTWLKVHASDGLAKRKQAAYRVAKKAYLQRMAIAKFSEQVYRYKHQRSLLERATSHRWNNLVQKSLLGLMAYVRRVRDAEKLSNKRNRIVRFRLRNAQFFKLKYFYLQGKRDQKCTSKVMASSKRNTKRKNFRIWTQRYCAKRKVYEFANSLYADRIARWQRRCFQVWKCYCWKRLELRLLVDQFCCRSILGKVKKLVHRWTKKCEYLRMLRRYENMVLCYGTKKIVTNQFKKWKLVYLKVERQKIGIRNLCRVIRVREIRYRFKRWERDIALTIAYEAMYDVVYEKFEKSSLQRHFQFLHKYAMRKSKQYQQREMATSLYHTAMQIRVFNGFYKHLSNVRKIKSSCSRILKILAKLFMRCMLQRIKSNMLFERANCYARKQTKIQLFNMWKRLHYRLVQSKIARKQAKCWSADRIRRIFFLLWKKAHNADKVENLNLARAACYYWCRFLRRFWNGFTHGISQHRATRVCEMHILSTRLHKVRKYFFMKWKENQRRSILEETKVFGHHTKWYESHLRERFKQLKLIIRLGKIERVISRRRNRKMLRKVMVAMKITCLQLTAIRAFVKFRKRFVIPRAFRHWKFISYRFGCALQILRATIIAERYLVVFSRWQVTWKNYCHVRKIMHGQRIKSILQNSWTFWYRKLSHHRQYREATKLYYMHSAKRVLTKWKKNVHLKKKVMQLNLLMQCHLTESIFCGWQRFTSIARFKAFINNCAIKHYVANSMQRVFNAWKTYSVTQMLYVEFMQCVAKRIKLKIFAQWFTLSKFKNKKKFRLSCPRHSIAYIESRILMVRLKYQQRTLRRILDTWKTIALQKREQDQDLLSAFDRFTRRYHSGARQLVDTLENRLSPGSHFISLWKRHTAKQLACSHMHDRVVSMEAGKYLLRWRLVARQRQREKRLTDEAFQFWYISKLRVCFQQWSTTMPCW